MDAKTFLDNFATIAEAPGGIQRLRDLVMDLALCGELSNGQADDEDVENTLIETTRRLQKLEDQREVLRRMPARSVSNPPHEIPSSWRWAPLGDLVAILDFRRQPIKQDDRLDRIAGKAPDELFPYYGATQQAGVIDDYLFDEELVMLGEDGAPFLTPGKDVSYLASGKYWVNNHAHVLRGMAVTNRFLKIVLNRVDYTDFVTGTTRLKLTQGKMINIPIPVPPLAEQDRIVAKVDELMALCDDLEVCQQRRHRATTHFRASALHTLTESETPDALRAAWGRISSTWELLLSGPENLGDIRLLLLQLAVTGRLSKADDANGHLRFTAHATDEARGQFALPGN